jgi:hypothetical protein
MTIHSAKFVNERNNNSKMRCIHLVYEKYIILATRISRHNQNILKIANSKFSLEKIAKKCG